MGRYLSLAPVVLSTATRRRCPRLYRKARRGWLAASTHRRFSGQIQSTHLRFESVLRRCMKVWTSIGSTPILAILVETRRESVYIGETDPRRRSWPIDGKVEGNHSGPSRSEWPDFRGEVRFRPRPNTQSTEAFLLNPVDNYDWGPQPKKRAIPAASRRALAVRHGTEPGGCGKANCAKCNREGRITWHQLRNGRPSSCVTFTGLEIDHIKPHSKGGSHDPENLQLLCAHCNRSKGDK